MCSVRVSSSGLWLRPRRLCTNSITVGYAGARHLRRVVQCAARHPMRRSNRLAHGLLGELDQLRMERPRRDAPLQLPLHLAALFLGDAPAGLHGVGEHRLQRLVVEVALVDHQLADRRHRGHDASGRRDRADRRDTPRRLGDAPSLEHEARRRGHGVAPHVHRRRSDVGALAAEADDVALDAVRAEYDRQGQVEALEHRALLDVQLQVGGGSRRAAGRVSRLLEVDAVLGEHLGECRARGVAQAAEQVRVEALRGGARAEQAATEAEAFLVGPVDEPHRRRRAARPPPAGAAPRARRARSGSRRASRRWRPSRDGRRSARRARRRPEASPRGCRPRPSRRSRARPRAARGTSCGPATTSRSSTPAGPHSRRR